MFIKVMSRVELESEFYLAVKENWQADIDGHIIQKLRSFNYGRINGCITASSISVTYDSYTNVIISFNPCSILFS